MDWDTQALLVLELSERNGRKESACHRVWPVRGRVLHTERYSAGLHHIKPLWGREGLLVSRAFEPAQRMLPGWFHGGMLEHKGRVQERWFLEGLEFEAHTIRAASISPISNRVYGQYWYLDPFSGRAAGGGEAIFVLKDDRSLFFQTRDPKMFLGPERSLCGEIRLVVGQEGDRLLFPWSQAAGGCGVSVVDGESMRLLGDLVFQEGLYLSDIVVDGSLGNAIAVLSDGEGGWVLERAA